MSPADHNLLILCGIALMGVLAWLARYRPCSCEKCAFHVNEHRMDAEARRAKRHRDFHRDYRVPWDEEKCGSCRAGNLGDKQ